jgi:GT2 family glycosyltransferase
MSVEAIVLDIDGGAMLAACIESLHAQTRPFSRVIVFDNGSRTPVSLPNVEVLRSETNLGFTGGVNEAFRHVRGEFVALINNDVTLDRDWLETVLAAMARDPKLAAVQTIIRRDEHTIDGAGIDISDGTFRQIVSGEAWGVSATAALYRTAALGERVFDPKFFAYYEDVELCARLQAAGWRTQVLPVVKATHRGSASANVLGGKALRLRTRNRYLVARMHPGVGKIRALLFEDMSLLLRGRSSIRGIIEGLL